jgi:trimeric autotransporter adhesin
MRSRATALVCVLTFSIALLGAVGAAVAQTYQGTIRGIVKDEQGVIPAAEVTLVNEATSATRSITTNEVGEYVFTSVLPGTYTLRAALPGFRTEERKGLKVATQQQVVADFTLAIGGVAEQITVSGEAPLVERSTATVATSLSAKDISNLPIFGRNTFY